MSVQRFFVPAAAGVTALGGYVFYQSRLPPKSREEQRRDRANSKREAGLSGAGVGQNAQTGLHEKGGPGSGVPTQNTDPDRAVKTDAPREKLPSGGVGGGVGAGGANTRAVDISAKKSSGPEGANSHGAGSRPSGNTSSGDKASGNDKASSGSDSSNLSKSSEKSGNGGGGGGQFGAGSGSSPDGPSSSNTTSTGGGSSDSGRGSSKAGAAQDTDPKSGSSSISQGLQGMFGQGGGSASDRESQPTRMYHDTKVHSNHADTPTKRFS